MFNREVQQIWDDFRATRAQIKADLERAVQANNIASPDAVDPNALEPLKSGVMTADDFEAFASRYDGNATMLRLVGKYAKEAAGADANPNSRARLNVVAEAASSGKSLLEAF